MRTESSVLTQLRTWAENWDNVRAVVLTGSRVGPRSTADALSDYDVEVYVRDLKPITEDDSWLHEFGPIMVRWPLRPRPTFDDQWVTQLVLFDDGVRIDFDFTVSPLHDIARPDGGFSVVIDKDDISNHLASPSNSNDLLTPPTTEEFATRMNAFWWDISYVAKALRRGELNYAKYMLDGTIRFDKLQPLIQWHIGTLHGWSVNPGTYGRWFHRYVDEPTWEHYLRTFSTASIDDNWRALFETTVFVNIVGNRLADHLGFDYPDSVDTKVTRHIHRIKEMDSTELQYGSQE